MFTDSSAEASALGSGPRGRRFKSALSESQKTTTSLLVYNSIAEMYNPTQKTMFFLFQTPVSGSFFLNRHTTHCENSCTISSGSCQMLTLLWKKTRYVQKGDFKDAIRK